MQIPLHRLLERKTQTTPEGLAFRFLPDGEEAETLLTYGALADRAKATAAGLARLGVGGQPVILAEPAGLDFITGLFACWYAGAIAVPAYPPRGTRHRRRFEAILRDSGAKFAIAAAEKVPADGVTFLNADELASHGSPPLSLPDQVIDPSRPCVLQYTSGSTANPKGVKISHLNLRAHFASLSSYHKLELQSALSWLPPYHDMGLVLKILYAFEAGIPLTFFSPEHFIQRPARWLRAISRYRAELSGAPNFAFEMCLRSIRDEDLEGVDLSCWKAAPCGAERVRPETLERFAGRFAHHGFRMESFLPGYGLAEATLSVTAPSLGELPRISKDGLVSSGCPLPGIQLRIADPLDGTARADGQLGEIRVKGAVVSGGYWNNGNQPDATLETFGPETDRELRTGDLGYLEDGRLYVTGRIKDLIILDGINHSPEDIETAAFSCADEITAAAAFAVENHGRETVVLAIEAPSLKAGNGPEICRNLRHAIGETLEVPISRILLVKAGFLPRTTSGKVRRAACAEALAGGRMKPLYDDASNRASATADADMLGILLECVHEVTGRGGAGAAEDLIGFGMNSMETTRLAAVLQSRTGAALSLGELFSARSFGEIATQLESRGKGKPALPPIIAGSGSGTNVLTHSQERMWFLHQLNPESAAYHVFGSLEFRGPLEVDTLDQSVRAVISRHDILCSRHGTRDGQPWITVVQDRMQVVQRHSADNEAALQDYLTNFARHPFRLAEDSPIRVCIATCGNDRHVLAISVHHIVADGWSLRILAGQISEAYTLLSQGKPMPTRETGTPGYLDYAACHRRWIDSGAVDSQVSYWQKRLAGHPGVMSLPTDFPRPAKPTSDGGAIEGAIPAELCNRIAALAKTHRCTPFMVHLAAFLLLLGKHGGGDDLVVAVPVANRNHFEAGDLVGTLVNTLPFRLGLDPNGTFSSLLDRVREATFEMQAAQDAPFEKIIGAVKPDRSGNQSPLAQVMFDYQEIPLAETWQGGVECKPFVAHRGAVQFDLSLLLTVLKDRQQLTIEYATDLFLRETAHAIFQRYLVILATACEEPGTILREIGGLLTEDRKLLEESSNGPVRPEFPKQVTPALIAKRAALHPDRMAVISGDRSLSYGALEAVSAKLASALATHGVRPGDRVGILLNRDLDLPVALLAIWKAGAAYVPLDAANPTERLKLILEDQNGIPVLASPDLTTRLPDGTPTILMDPALLENTTDPASAAPSPRDAAYIIYTSGSTGKPKGVEVSHGALANFLLSMAEKPGFTEADRLLAVTTISFDISGLEIFLPLIIGGTVDIVSSATARDGEALLERLRASNATVMQATPATWRMLLDTGWKGSPDLKILCGGEALDLPLARQLSGKGCQFWNLYGPTETTIWSTLWKVPSHPESILIGSPIANTGIHILAPDGSALPPGVPGELWISGDGLAEGYWNRPDLTDKSFLTPDRGPRRYHTGDIARWRADGSLECLGRSDNQVKIRGFRVELGEIESVISTHPAVAQVKVALRGSEANRRLVAWIIPFGDPVTADTKGLRDYLASRLPSHMIPADIGFVGAFPLGSSGKVDVSKLENPEPVSQAAGPLGPTEERLARVWSSLLERPVLNRDLDWFQIGGHSLLALRLFSRIRAEFNTTLPLSAVLDHPTLGALASAIDRSLAAEKKP